MPDLSPQADIESFVNHHFSPPPLDYFAPPKERIRAEDQHLKHIRSKYGNKTIDEYLRLCKACKKSSPKSDKAYFLLEDLVFRTGLCNETPAHIVQRGTETLKGLLELLSSREKEFTLLDLGSGDGRIAIGLALYLNQLATLYAVDRNVHALERLNLNLQQLSTDEQEKARRKIVSVCGDYFDIKVQQEIFAHTPCGFDIVLAAHQQQCYEPDARFQLFLKLLHPYGSVIVAETLDTSGRENAVIPQYFVQGAAEMLTDRFNEWAQSHHISFTLIDAFDYNSTDGLALLEGKRDSPSSATSPT